MSKIEWTHRPGTKSEVWNPVSGCSLESAGCTNCYAMHFAHRFSGEGAPFEGLTKKTNSGVKWNGKIRLNTDRLTKPLSWKTPRTCFVNSMSDLFHPDVPFDFIDNVFAVMDCCPDSTFIILTKRADRMLEYFVENRGWRVGQLKVSYNSSDYDLNSWPLKNVWLGVSVEDQKTADERIPLLLQIPARVRFLSCEPLLGPIDLTEIHLSILGCAFIDALRGLGYGDAENTNTSINWVIAGGESGHNARPMHPDWVRSLRDQCAAAGVPFFFKQWGEWYTTAFNISTQQPAFKMYHDYQHFTQKDWVSKGMKCVDMDGKQCEIGGDFMTARYPVVILSKVGKSKSGNTLDGVQHLNFPA